MNKVPTVSAAEFLWHGHLGITDSSDLGVGTVPTIDVVSPRTGVTRRFELVSTDKSEEGEVTAWRYASKGAPYLQLQVFND